MDQAASVAIPPEHTATSAVHSKLNKSPGMIGMVIFGIVLVGGMGYAVSQLAKDLSGTHLESAWPYLLLGLALFIALAFEFVNGFHDTANAVATVIYTHTLEPHIAVVWSGMWNLIGVLTSSGAVAYTIVTLLPVELVLQVGKGAGFAMVFSLLLAAIIWNLSTWWLGLPASSSHTLVGSIIGVGLANQLMSVKSGTSGVDWGQAANVFKVLLISPVVGFVCAALLLLLLKLLVKKPELYESPKGDAPPPLWIRSLLVLTCTGVSFGHGSNDGQKGMGLIMLILIGTVPTVYALNRTMPPAQMEQFIANSAAAAKVVEAKGEGYNVLGDPRPAVTAYVALHKLNEGTFPSLAALMREISKQVSEYGSLTKIPAAAVGNTRNDMYLTSEAIRFLMKDKESDLSKEDIATLTNYKKSLDDATKFIPFWVKIAVAIALGLGTMIGWKRIVVTVGEKIGKTHLTYGQGAAAELVAAATIFAADSYGLPVSTTHVLSSGVAGAMAANGSGLQLATIRNMAMAWVLTLPVAIMLSGGLYFIFAHL